MPICEAVHNVVKGQMSVDEAIEALLSRPLRAEMDFPPAVALDDFSCPTRVKKGRGTRPF